MTAYTMAGKVLATTQQTWFTGFQLLHHHSLKTIAGAESDNSSSSSAGTTSSDSI